MFNVREISKRIAAPFAAFALVAGISTLTATPASASTIKDGWIQLCPWGNYRVHLTYDVTGLPQQLTPVLNPGDDCWWGPMPAGVQYALIDMVGHFNTSGGTFAVIGPDRKYETFYNGKGIGFAAEGTTESHGLAAHYYRY
ncbi:hypothetical protein GCM10010269_32200 [Streptomyces humidus]|uniref:Uncharacterized protein n=1 Tax=Streptomyces humidus TaxID=52259 RepID=A0A918FWM5_9ACTN|nr:hypothetical protein [Streptomyces humidus]GGR90577.1 hypothetical protein GCM10010269_32200 [Streptomyces humidus]